MDTTSAVDDESATGAEEDLDATDLDKIARALADKIARALAHTHTLHPGGADMTNQHARSPSPPPKLSDMAKPESVPCPSDGAEGLTQRDCSLWATDGGWTVRRDEIT